MRLTPLLLAIAVVNSGCTAHSLERQTLATSNSAMDLRYKEVIDNLALIAHEPATLPSYSSIFSGTIQIADSAGVSSSTLWVAKFLTGTVPWGFASETAGAQLSRNISDNWSLDPIIAPEKLEVMRSACQWVLFGPDKIPEYCSHLLLSPLQDPTPGRHFGVADRLARLPAGWLHVGKHEDVPSCAVYKGHYKGTWVWVTAEGMAGFSEFTLALQDIAWVSINSQSLFYYPAPPCVLTRSSESKNVQTNELTVVTAAIAVDGSNKPVPLVPCNQLRFDNKGTASALRSQISAASGP